MKNNLLSLVNNYVQDRTHEAFSNLINYTIRLNKYFYKQINITYEAQARDEDGNVFTIVKLDYRDNIEEVIKEYKKEIRKFMSHYSDYQIRLVKITTETVNCDEN